MNGPGHYRAAERLLALAEIYDDDSLQQMSALVTAQVHATLASAAATALQPREALTTAFRDQVAAPWAEVAG